jgi:hypothetical protein
VSKSRTLALTLITLTIAALATTVAVHADTAVNVTVLDCSSQTYGNKGLISGGYWIGQIPLNVSSGSTFSKIFGYCINFDRAIYVGGTYPATFVAANDTAEWRAISYLLSWDSPTSNNGAAAAQVAVWRLLNQTRGTNYYSESWLDQSIDTAGDNLASQAVGKDVFRQGDQFSWVSPVSNNGSTLQASPNQTITFTARLTSSSGSPRANVRILFNVTLNSGEQTQPLNSTYLSCTEAFTDSQGLARVKVTVPAGTPLGAGVTVDASSRSVWPQRFIDVSDPSTQDLLGEGNAFQLTISSFVHITATLQVIPEYTLGGLVAFAACFSAFAVFKLRKNHIS